MSDQYLKLRRSAVPGKIPTTESIDYGEIALNTYDGLAFMKKSGSNGIEVVPIGILSGSFTGSLEGTSSWAINAQSSSYALNSTTASFVNYISSSVGTEYSIIRANNTKYLFTTYEATSNNQHLYINSRHLFWTGSSVASRTIGQMVAIGGNSLENAGIDGSTRASVAFGAIALRRLRVGEYNVGIGPWALEYLTNGERNVGLGQDAGGGVATGSFNTFVGAEAGYANNQSSTQNNMIVIGYRAQYTASSPTNNISNTTVIGNNINTSLSNVVLLGRSDQNVIIGNSVSSLITSDPGYKLHVIGSGNFTEATTVSGSLIAAGGDFSIVTGSTSYLKVYPTTGNVYVGSSPTDGGFKLDVNGTTRLQGALTVTNGGANVNGGLVVTGSITASQNIRFGGNQSIEGSANVGNWTFRNSGGGGWYFEWIQNNQTAMILNRSNNLLVGTTVSASAYRVEIARNAQGSGSLKVDTTFYVTGSRVGINNSAPQFDLDVSGSGRFTNGLTVTGSINVLSNINSPSITGSLFGTSSWAINALNANTASNILGGKAPHVPFFITDTTLATSSIYQSGSSTVIINQDAATSANPEALYVWQPSTSSFNVISGKGNLDNYLQLNIQNTNQGPNASSDVVATANNGSEVDNYIDMGINSENFAGFLGGPNDSYLYSHGHNMWIGNVNDGYSLHLFNSSSINPLVTLTPSNTVDVNTTLNAPDITGSLEGTASWAKNVISASHAVNSDFAGYAQTAGTAANGGVTKLIAGSGITLLPSNGLGNVTVIAGGGGGGVTILSGSNVTQSFSNASTWNFAHNLGIRTPVISVFDSNYNQVIPESIQLVDTSSAIITFPTLESGFAIATVGGVTGDAYSASYALFSTYADTASYYAETDPIFVAKSASLATTGSNLFVGTQRVTGSIIVTGSVTVSGSSTFTNIGPAIFNGTVDVSGSSRFSNGLTVTGSLVVTSGSTEFQVLDTGTKIGNSLSDNHTVTGSLNITGSVTYNGNKIFNFGQFQSNVAQSGSANVSQSIQFDTTDLAIGIALESGSRLRIQNKGYYNIIFSAQCDNLDNSTQSIYIWFKKNGTNVPESTTQLTIPKNQAQVMTVNFLNQANADDYYELAWQSTNDLCYLVSPTTPVNVPLIPSVITTVTQIA